MTRKREVIKNLTIYDEEIEVTFYNEVTSKRLTKFIEDVENFESVLDGVSAIYVQQFVHALLIIKHFTDYEIEADTTEDFLYASQEFTQSGILEEFARNFDRKLVQEVNQATVAHFLLNYGYVPEYLDFGGNKHSIEQIKQEIENDDSYEDWDFGWDEYSKNDDDFDDDDDEDDISDFEWEINHIKQSLKPMVISVNLVSSLPEPKEVKKELEEAKTHSIDKMLDEYNDYLGLYEMFNDEEYKLRAEHVMRVLKGEESYNELKL